MAEERPARFDWRDAATGLLLLLFVGWYVWAELDLRGRPEEDAAMLMRYSRHLAAGHGIVWNIGEKPVDGATDFLFMVVLAAVHGLGLSLETAARAIGLFAAHAATVWLVFWSARRVFGASRQWALVPAVFSVSAPACGISPRLRHAALRPARDPWYVAWRTATSHAPTAGAGAPRARLRARGARDGPRAARGRLPRRLHAARRARRSGRARNAGDPDALPVVFLTLGLLYFLWRWQYFGYPLPNPFYKKGGGASTGTRCASPGRTVGARLAVPVARPARPRDPRRAQGGAVRGPAPSCCSSRSSC